MRQNNRESDPCNSQEIYQEEKNVTSQLKWATGTPDTPQRRAATVAAACREWQEPLEGEGLEPIKVQVKKLFHMAITLVHIGPKYAGKTISWIKVNKQGRGCFLTVVISHNI